MVLVRCTWRHVPYGAGNCMACRHISDGAGKLYACGITSHMVLVSCMWRDVPYGAGKLLVTSRHIWCW